MYNVNDRKKEVKVKRVIQKSEWLNIISNS